MSEKNQVIPFQFEKINVRVVVVDGEPWFVAADVCAALGIGNTTDALRRLDDDEQALDSIEGISRGNDRANIINESGLYSLILGSRKPEAKKFKKWVTSEVLPSIRKTGSYLAAGSFDSLPENMRAQIGGIVKSVIIHQIDNAIIARLPQLAEAFLSRQQMGVRHGITAGQIVAQYGLPKMKNLAQVLSRWLKGCEIDGGGRGELGGKTAKLFDPDKVAARMKTGLLDHCKKYVQERQGQGNLFAIKAPEIVARQSKS